MADGKLHVNEHEEGAGACRKALALLSAMDRTEAELREKLRRNGFSDEAAGEAVSYVKKLHYLDDERYARGYILSRQGRFSRQRIEYDLRRKGVSPEIIESAFDEAGEDNERELIRKLAEKKLRTLAGEPKARQKLGAFLSRKGFRMSDVIAVMEEISLTVPEEKDIF